MITVALTAGAPATSPAFADGRGQQADTDPTLFDRLFGGETQCAQQAYPTTAKQAILAAQPMV